MPDYTGVYLGRIIALLDTIPASIEGDQEVCAVLCERVVLYIGGQGAGFGLC